MRPPVLASAALVLAMAGPSVATGNAADRCPGRVGDAHG